MDAGIPRDTLSWTHMLSYSWGSVSYGERVGAQESSHSDALAIPLPSLIQPFLDPPKEQGITALLTHGGHRAI